LGCYFERGYGLVEATDPCIPDAASKCIVPRFAKDDNAEFRMTGLDLG